MTDDDGRTPLEESGTKQCGRCVKDGAQDKCRITIAMLLAEDTVLLKDGKCNPDKGGCGHLLHVHPPGSAPPQAPAATVNYSKRIKGVLHVAVLTSGDVFRAASVTTTTSSSSRTDSSARSPPLNSSHTQPTDPLCVVAVVVSSMRPTHELLPLLRQATEERGITMARRSPTEGGTTPSSCLVSAPSLSSAAADAKGDADAPAKRAPDRQLEGKPGCCRPHFSRSVELI